MRFPLRGRPEPNLTYPNLNGGGFSVTPGPDRQSYSGHGDVRIHVINFSERSRFRYINLTFS